MALRANFSVAIVVINDIIYDVIKRIFIQDATVGKALVALLVAHATRFVCG